MTGTLRLANSSRNSTRLSPASSAPLPWETRPSAYHSTAAAVRTSRATSWGLLRRVEKTSSGSITSMVVMALRLTSCQPDSTPGGSPSSVTALPPVIYSSHATEDETMIPRSLMMALAFTAVLATEPAHAQAGEDWPVWGHDPGGQRFSPLATIDRGNVRSLKVAWTFHTGDAYQPKGSKATAFEATPLYVDGTLYLSTPLGRVIALDPVTGQQRWAFDAKSPRDMGYGDFASRGVSSWQRGSERRIFVATIDARLVALDAATGQPIPAFGERGTVDLRKGLRIAPRGVADYEVTSPPAVIGDTIVVGSGIPDNGTTTEPSGEVRAFDAITGRLKWSWDPIPQEPSAVGANTWKNGSATRTGAGNAWSVIVADPARNLVFVPTSSPSPDYFGGERLGDDLFTDSVVALRADTGARVWHFQTVHHDLWDYDVASPPILFDWQKDGRTVAAVGIASKTGHFFVLDRATGQPLIPVEERAVPKSDVPGEEASPTQPFPTAPRSLARTN